ncbi:folylpolyglutamate synthase [Buchnera aphidicola str. Bp (Baizongia pistaciae)]|uniref:Dihydrofolate synthase/folylpolyglutamate synthase n=1 Tax=Buchnera aphidicola subsp. Baizongia pistaciae (strain Bp) TaxID=224915 RepID=FOLC_BUCBP|nr:bifunctional tetrahydrofolate synthase/dihydrofolate synthase [Buchnera aphidicola]Q89AT2.1 RecName: Full=Dihydrofolate synthase/folylpolyglutamate synthase; Short=DHFS / FPGS; AltName: Full=Folylpoly-gamma-glutamate synthetase-dihydrofolate synthetase; AltName: Full=Folylpolyglutamate synthetase; AltName: Full=Tetrahydrofolylpolyglutamate synthase [Buchnera aphidicola str. Bp (Baizongia pistaciae)]AAO26891.1 folylpolyglutamate synthase [Buchnera aphidicola str. Bp (Baizongia pistaciae)]
MINKKLARSFSLYEWLYYLDHFMLDNIDPTLNRVFYVAKKLGVLKSKAFVFIVGGTNGKGSTCHVLENLLLNSGYRVGLYTSPHLMRYTERVRINGFELEHLYHISAFNDVKYFQNDVLLTRFEFITLSALILFKSYNLDIIILEVGLGGRLDATNILSADVSVITNIDIDHSKILGVNRSSISVEKSGIFRKNKIAIVADNNFPKVAQYLAKKKKVRLRIVNIDWIYKKIEFEWSFCSSKITWLHLPLPRNVSLDSVATALSAVSESGIKINQKVFRSCISEITLCGRFETISYNPIIILDVAHNPHSARYLFKKMSSFKKNGNIFAVVGILKEKNIKDIVSPLIPIVDYWYCITLLTHRSATSSEIIKYLPNHNSQISKNMTVALEKIFDKVTNNDIVLIFGSFITVCEANKFLANKVKNFKLL